MTFVPFMHSFVYQDCPLSCGVIASKITFSEKNSSGFFMFLSCVVTAV